MEKVKKYAPGMRVMIRGEEWMIKKIENNTLGNKALYVVGLSRLVKDQEAIFLDDLEKDNIEIVDPTKVKLVPDDSPYFRKSRLFIESQWRQKIPTDSKIHVGDKAAMDLMTYQLTPSQVSLSKPRQRILIADTVGLGKTLEAGILMSELIARGKGKRILVVTVKSMMTQFQKEMWNRFTIPLVRLDSSKIQSIRSKMPSNANPFFYPGYDKTIISIDTLKNDLEYRTHLENAWWDIIVIDEAHNVAKRGKNSARHKLADLLATRSDTLIMLSATPHDGRAESFASLMNMLDPTAIANPEEYTKDDISDLCIRRFKKDIQSEVAGAFKEREISVMECAASAAEEYAFDIFACMHLDMDEKKTKGNKDRLFKTNLEKSMFSSPAACISSIKERIKRLEKKYGSIDVADITKLREFQEALEKIDAKSFSRYAKLVELLKGSEYNWNANKSDDRIVIFTERIETMKYVAENLRKDLGLSAEQVQTMYGGMNDKEQQKIVDEFGRAESPVRILVASDVASEGINLHYLSHRLIHFDIPWSLMVFQQRNGRVDRYGQKEKPDIRFFVTDCKNEKIKGDSRILEILTIKEEQAYKNIGDPAVLLGKFDAEEEKSEIMRVIEEGISADEFEKMLDSSEDEFDPFELMMAGMTEDSTKKKAVYEYCEDETLFSDLDYLKMAFAQFAEKDTYPVRELSAKQGVEITMTPDMRKKLRAVLPSEAMPEGDVMKLSIDKEFCMKEMQRCMQNDLAEVAWPSTQYLWKLHPIYGWINDKAGMNFRRMEAPILTLPSRVKKGEYIFIVAGLIPNRKSTPVIDEWFGVKYVNGVFSEILSMEDMISITGIGNKDIPNSMADASSAIQEAEAMLVDVVAQAKRILKEKAEQYKKDTDPYIYQEMSRLEGLREKRKYVQLSLFDDERKKSQRERLIDELFDSFIEWESETLEIEADYPYIRIIASITGVN